MTTIVTTEMELEDGTNISIQGYVHYLLDNNYGADADGNRVGTVTEVEEVTEIKAYDDDLKEIELSEEDIERATEILTREFLEN